MAQLSRRVLFTEYLKEQCHLQEGDRWNWREHVGTLQLGPKGLAFVSGGAVLASPRSLFIHLRPDTQKPNGQDYAQLELEFKRTGKKERWTDLAQDFAKRRPDLRIDGVSAAEVMDFDDSPPTDAAGNPSSTGPATPTEDPAAPAKEHAGWLLPEEEREEIIEFFISTMEAIGLEASLAEDFFITAGLYRSLPSHLTVPGVARRLVSGKFLELQASEGDEGAQWKELESSSDFKLGLIKLGFKREIAEQWANEAEGRSLMYFQHKGLLQVAFDLIDLRLHGLAAGDYRGDEPTTGAEESEDGQGRRQQKGKQDRGGAKGRGRGNGDGDDGGGSGRRSGKGGRDGDGGNEREEGEGRDGQAEDTQGPCPDPVPDCILLYHGTTEEHARSIMQCIDVTRGQGKTDFARSGGFYVGDSFSHAKTWATETTADANNMLKWLDKLGNKVLEFESANDEWKKFVSANRAIDPREQPPKHKCSVIIGPALSNPKLLFSVSDWRKAKCLEGFTQYALVRDNVAVSMKSFFHEWYLKDAGAWTKAEKIPVEEEEEEEEGADSEGDDADD